MICSKRLQRYGTILTSNDSGLVSMYAQRGRGGVGPNVYEVREVACICYCILAQNAYKGWEKFSAILLCKKIYDLPFS